MGAVVVAVLLLLAVGVALTAVSSARGSTTTDSVSRQPVSTPSTGAGGAASGAGLSGAGQSGADPSAERVFVHVLGRVAKPGLYEVGEGARAIDVVTLAGGFTAGADQRAVNLARLVTDGEQIVVPAVGEAQPAAGGGAPVAGADPSASVVDLNTADAAALESLAGVGPATATAIIDWRTEHGRFASVDDLLDVSGIGAKKLEGLREQVVVR